MSDSSNSGKMDAIFSELKENPPSIVNSTRRKFGAARARKQNIAIALSKARQSGMNVPKKAGY